MGTRRKTGFTLIELLVVIGIIAVLSSLLFTIVGAILKTRKRALAMKQIKEIEEAAKSYWRDWNVYPPDSGEYESDDPVPNGLTAADVKYAIHRYLGLKLQNTITGETHGPYLSIKPDFLQEGATVDGLYAQVFVDPWGNPYEMDCMHVLRDPKTGTLQPPSFPYPVGTPQTEQSLEVKVWSKGPDGKASAQAQFYGATGAGTDDSDEDNIMSWAKGKN
jgi:prepilin-type N-terminal cleavage/methylation domain-containing protein